ncbi:MAG: amidohydrolase family protein [Conexivisphaera sp.]
MGDAWGRPLRADVPVSCVLDAHVHSPILRSAGEANEYLRGLLSMGLGGAVILGIPPSRDVLSRITLEDVAEEYERNADLVRKFASEISSELTPESLYLTAERFLEGYCQFRRHSEISALSNFELLYPANLSIPPDDLKGALEEALRRGFGGFKVISTFFLRRLDDPAVEAVLEVAESEDVPVTVHTGCDPGIWELPKYCKYGDPSRLDPLLARHRGVRVVLAHAGSYSAIAPGVFIEEALDLVRRYPEVYADTAALPPGLVEMVLRDFPRGKVMYGSDYPAVAEEDPRRYLEDVFLTLESAGHGTAELEDFSRAVAERVFSVECSEWP